MQKSFENMIRYVKIQTFAKTVSFSSIKFAVCIVIIWAINLMPDIKIKLISILIKYSINTPFNSQPEPTQIM